jgi:thiaminase/transcriptional activator TenA
MGGFAVSFADDVEKMAGPIRRAILNHPFVTGIGDGTLDVEKFKFYVRQDYIYLVDYSRVLALASARAQDLDTMSRFARLLNETLNTEMDLHRSYCAQFGITAEELEGTRAAPTTRAYTGFLLNVAHQGSYPELAASFLPCQWGYWEVGNYLARKGVPREAPLYSQWIQMYISPEYKSLADWARSLVNRLAEQAGPAEAARMEEIYLTACRYEYLFWDMAYKLETWPV